MHKEQIIEPFKLKNGPEMENDEAGGQVSISNYKGK